MEFGLGEQQRLLDDSLRALLADGLALESLRTIAEAGTGHDDDLGQSLAELGLSGLLVPEALGGAGFAMLDAAVAAEALGHAAAPQPFLASAVMAPKALAESGSEAQQRECDLGTKLVGWWAIAPTRPDRGPDRGTGPWAPPSTPSSPCRCRKARCGFHCRPSPRDGLCTRFG